MKEQGNDNDNLIGYHESSVLSRKISSNIEMRLEDNQTNVYIDGNYVATCMDLKVIIPRENIQDFDQINSIDEISDLLNNSDSNPDIYYISPEEEFWGHCSNIQAWVENDYNTRILHSNIAFPLLTKLTRIGDPLARNVFKIEIVERFSSGEKSVILFLLKNHYLNYLDEFEEKCLIESVIINFDKFKITEFNEFVELCEEIFMEVGYNSQRSFLIKNFNEILNFIVIQLSGHEFDGRKLHILYDSLDKLMSFLIRHEKRFLSYEMANYKIKNYFSSDADAEIRNGTRLYIQYRKHNFYTETNILYGFKRYGVLLDLKTALFGNENVILSSIWFNDFNNLIVEVILSSKKACDFINENFPDVSDWFNYGQNAIDHLTDLEQGDLDFTDKIYCVYLIIWNLLCGHPKQRGKKLIRQANFFFKLTEFFSISDCDVTVKDEYDNSHLPQRGFRHQDQDRRFVLIVKNRNEQFYRRIQDKELYDIIKSLFFRDENLTITAALWNKHHEIFKISTKFDSIEMAKKQSGE